MKYNEEMFDRTLKAADLSTVDFDSPITWDDEILKFGEKYLNLLLAEETLIQKCVDDADRYYYMMATHAMYAAFCMSSWDKMGAARGESFEAITTMDAIMTFRLNWSIVDTENIDWYASTVFDMAIRDFENMYNQNYVIDNDNEYILGILMAFFVIGYNLKPKYFDD